MIKPVEPKKPVRYNIRSLTLSRTIGNLHLINSMSAFLGVQNNSPEFICYFNDGYVSKIVTSRTADTCRVGLNIVFNIGNNIGDTTKIDLECTFLMNSSPIEGYQKYKKNMINTELKEWPGLRLILQEINEQNPVSGNSRRSNGLIEFISNLFKSR